MNYYLAIDLGASSGRHIVGHKEKNDFVLEEIYRFRTGMDDSKDGLVWDIQRLLNEIKIGIKKAFEKYKQIESLSIDCWGVDYVLLNGDKDIPPYYAYRNSRNNKAAEKVCKIVPFKEIYSSIGIQYNPFNTIFQLFDDLNKGRLEQATDYLMLPSYFSYRLTGIKSHEYTNESTGSLLNAFTKQYDLDLLTKVGLPKKLFNKLDQPGTVLGYLTDEVVKEVGGQTKVILCASHDTASAFEAVDVPEDGIIISSGTWSLFGIKTKNPICNEKSLKANFTNEGGVGYIRFLKNIMGMWLVNQVVLQEGLNFNDLINSINQSTYFDIFNVNDESLVSPKNMKQAILKLLSNNPPKNDLELFSSIYHSLAKAYNDTCLQLESITGKKYKSIYVIGGGAKNEYLNKLIEEKTGKRVVALPIEATSLGNIKIQDMVSNQK